MVLQVIHDYDKKTPARDTRFMDTLEEEILHFLKEMGYNQYILGLTDSFLGTTLFPNNAIDEKSAKNILDHCDREIIEKTHTFLKCLIKVDEELQAPSILEVPNLMLAYSPQILAMLIMNVMEALIMGDQTQTHGSLPFNAASPIIVTNAIFCFASFAWGKYNGEDIHLVSFMEYLSYIPRSMAGVISYISYDYAEPHIIIGVLCLVYIFPFFANSVLNPHKVASTQVLIAVVSLINLAAFIAHQGEISLGVALALITAGCCGFGEFLIKRSQSGDFKESTISCKLFNITLARVLTTYLAISVKWIINGEVNFEDFLLFKGWNLHAIGLVFFLLIGSAGRYSMYASPDDLSMLLTVAITLSMFICLFTTFFVFGNDASYLVLIELSVFPALSMLMQFAAENKEHQACTDNRLDHQETLIESLKELVGDALELEYIRQGVNDPSAGSFQEHVDEIFKVPHAGTLESTSG